MAVCQGWWDIEILPKILWVWNWQIMVWILSAGLKKGVVYWNFCEHFWHSSESCNVEWLGKCEQAVVQSIKATFNNMQYSSVSALSQILCTAHCKRSNTTTSVLLSVAYFSLWVSKLTNTWFSLPTEYCRKIPNAHSYLGCFHWLSNLAV